MKYRKKPGEVEAKLYDGTNGLEIAQWSDHHAGEVFETSAPLVLAVHTLHGTTKAEIGDWVIRGPGGDYWPCKPDIFEATYERDEYLADCQPYLGCATTAQMLNELTVRAEIGGYAGYRTVDSDE